jgi:hypothetical protein
MFAKARLFQKIFMCIMTVFIGLMGVVAFCAYSRSSGATRQDMAEAQFIRQQALIDKQKERQTAIAEHETSNR